MVQMETKMLMPSVPAAMAKLHQRNDAFVKFRNVNSVKKPPLDILEYIAHITPKIKEQRAREREDMLKQAVQLIDYVPFTQRFQRVTCPFAKKDSWKNATTIANEERKTKIQSFQWPVQEPQVVQEPKPKSKPEPEPELKPELKSNSESEAEPKSKTEIETETKSEPHVKYYSEQELEDIGVQEWQQLLSGRSLRRDPNSEWEEQLKLLRQWEIYPDYETMTTPEWLNQLVIESETEEDSIIQFKMYDPVTKSKVKEVKRLTKGKSVYKYFITPENANRMLSETVKYENVSPGNQNKNVQQCQPKTQIANRSLLRCQQNVNNTNSGAMNIAHQLPSISADFRQSSSTSGQLSSTSADFRQSSSTSGQLSSTSGQISSTRILRSSGQPVLTSHLNCQENVVTSTSCNQQINRQEENQDEAEMMKELNFHKQATQNGDTNEEPTFRHQMNVSEYINVGLTGSLPSSNNEEQSSTSQSQQAIASGRRRRRKTEENQRQNDIKNTLSDHCYHLNEPEGAKRLEMKESDEEEIDVESVENQATCFNSARTQHGKAAVAKANDTSTCRRPRGRPPGRNYGKRKRDAEDDQVDRPAPKRSRVKSNRRTVRHRNNIQQNQNESEESKRHNHNCLERQRRADLKRVYDNLRRIVPAVACKPKAAKVEILRHGRTYAIQIYKIAEQMRADLCTEAARFERLRHKHMALINMKIELEQERRN